MSAFRRLTPDANEQSWAGSRPVTRDSPLWLAAGLGFSLLFAARTMGPALGPDVIQDDARQHVFWMYRFHDPELFPHDLIADYFQSVAPPAYTAVYWTLSWVADPIVATKLLPPVLGCVTALFVFLLVRGVHASPAPAFLATVLLSWYVWQYDDLSSASPRAFLLPGLAALLWALATGRLVLCVVLNGLAALLYPVGGALGVGVVAARLVRFGPSWPALDRDRAAWLAFLASATIVAALLLPSQVAGSSFGPTVSARQAQGMPEFGESGRNAFFIEGGYRYWLDSYRSGLDLRVVDAQFPRIPLLFEYAALAALLPLLALARPRWRDPSWLAAPRTVTLQLLLASLSLFFLAHLLLFRLYLPARYVQWSSPLLLSIWAGLGLGIALERASSRFASGRVWPLAVGVAVALALYPAHYDGNFVRDEHPAITAFLRAQPREILVAAAAVEADSVPAFTGRRVLVAREYALAYQLGYYAEIRRRIQDLIDAYYADSPRRLVDFVARYGVDVVLVNRAAFDPTTFTDAWTAEFEPFTSTISSRLRRSGRFALLELAHQCAAVDDGRVAAVTADCLRAQP